MVWVGLYVQCIMDMAAKTVENNPGENVRRIRGR